MGIATNKRFLIECVCLFIVFFIAGRICDLLQLSNLQSFGVDIFAIGVSTILSNYIYDMLQK